MAFTDPHLAWEAERQGLLSKYAELEGRPADHRRNDDDQRRSSILDAQADLTIKIQTTPTKTIEGALVQIEVGDLEDIRLGFVGLDERDIRGIEARQRAVATIRHLMTEREG